MYESRPRRLDIDGHAPSAAAFFSAKQEAAAAEVNKAQMEYLAAAAAEDGATQTASGLVYKETQAGASILAKSGNGCFAGEVRSLDSTLNSANLEDERAQTKQATATARVQQILSKFITRAGSSMGQFLTVPTLAARQSLSHCVRLH